MAEIKMVEIGKRVIAINKVREGTVYSFGEGVYAGDFPLPPEAKGFNFGQKNPRIDLDNGKTVWGCECWWGSVERVKAEFPEDKYKWVTVDIDGIRDAKRSWFGRTVEGK